MSEAEALKDFVMDTLSDLGAEVSQAGDLIWVRAPEGVRRHLDVPSTFALAFDPARAGDFDAEYVAPGSYFLERLLSFAARRGRWDVARIDLPDRSWPNSALQEAGLSADFDIHSSIEAIEDDLRLLFSFRVSLVADEKRESYHRLAVSTRDGSASAIDRELNAARTVPAELYEPLPDVQAAYHLASDLLRSRMKDDIDRFRSKSLALFEEEVRRIFGYFDRTADEVREADPDGSQDLLRAIMADRDRRLSEALERFDPSATANLCSVLALFVPVARVRLAFLNGSSTEVRVDALTGRIDGLVCFQCHGSLGPWRWIEDRLVCTTCGATRDGSAPLPAHPPSDTPRRRTKAGRVAARSPRGSKARSRGASSRRRGP